MSNQFQNSKESIRQFLKMDWGKIILFTIIFLLVILFIQNIICLVFLGNYCSIKFGSLLEIVISSIPSLMIIFPLYFLSKGEAIEFPSRKFKIIPKTKMMHFLGYDTRKVVVYIFLVIVIWSFLEIFVIECVDVSNATTCTFNHYSYIQTFILNGFNERYRYLNGLSMAIFSSYFISCFIISAWDKIRKKSSV